MSAGGVSALFTAGSITPFLVANNIQHYAGGDHVTEVPKKLLGIFLPCFHDVDGKFQDVPSKVEGDGAVDIGCSDKIERVFQGGCEMFDGALHVCLQISDVKKHAETLSRLMRLSATVVDAKIKPLSLLVNQFWLLSCGNPDDLS